MRRLRSALLVLVVSLVAVCLGITSAAGSGRSHGRVAAGVDSAKAEISKYMKRPGFVAPGPPLNGKAIAKGKTIFVMAYSTQVPYNAAFNAAVIKYAKLAGFKAIEYPTGGLPDQWNRGVDQAISKHVNAIALTAGLDVRAIIPAIKRAQAAGIPVIASTWADVSESCPSYTTVCIGLSYHQAGVLEADYAIWKTNGAGSFLSVDGAPGIPADPAVRAGQDDAVKQNCPKCKLRRIVVPVTKWATDTAPETLGALKADSSINFVLAFYDSQALFIIPALNTLGKKLPITGFNGTPEILDLIRKGQVAMDPSENVGWAGAATVDAILRVLGKVTPNRGTIDEHIPLRVFDASNIGELGKGKIEFGAGFGGAESGYLKLWKVK